MLRFTLRQLEYLTACVDTGSLVAAAVKLNVSQPSISTAIAKLEDQLGVQLLIRHHAQGVVPTANARPLIQNAKELLAHANDFQNSIKMAEGEISGELSLGSFISLSPTHMPGLLMAMRQKYPLLQLQVMEGTQDQLVAGLRNGEYEAVIVYDLDLPDDVFKTVLLEVESRILLQKGHPLAEQTSVSLEDVVDEPLILLDILPSRNYFTGLFDVIGKKPKIGYRSSSIEFVRSMVGRGFGYSMLGTRPPGDKTYDGQDLVVCPIRENVPHAKMVLCRLQSQRPSAAVLELETFAASYFRKNLSMGE
ncbi:MAG: LysR family transcriptional regulator [Pseudomonadota bacterium]